MNYAQHVFVKNKLVDGVDSWYWLKPDQQCFDLIAADWPNHKLLVKQICKSSQVVIQAGGNLGMYPLLYSKLFDTVFTFEPDPLNFYCLTLNCQADNIIKIQAGLADEKNTAALYRVPHNVGMNRALVDETASIPLVMLDSFKFNCVDLIHLDIEGNEVTALKGAIETIKQHKPVLLIENGKRKEIESILKPMKYKIAGESNLDTAWVCGV